MKKILLFACVVVFASCANKKDSSIIIKESFDSIAVNLNDSAVNILRQERLNGMTDSIVNKCFALLDSSIIVDPHYVIAYINKIGLQKELRQYKDAIITTKELLSIKNTPEYIVELGILHQLTGDVESAQKEYNDAFEEFTERIKSGYATSADTMNLFFVDYLLNGKSQTLRDVKSISKSNPNIDYYIDFFENINHDKLLDMKK